MINTRIRLSTLRFSISVLPSVSGLYPGNGVTFLPKHRKKIFKRFLLKMQYLLLIISGVRPCCPLMFSINSFAVFGASGLVLWETMRSISSIRCTTTSIIQFTIVAIGSGIINSKVACAYFSLVVLMDEKVQIVCDYLPSIIGRYYRWPRICQWCVS